MAPHHYYVDDKSRRILQDTVRTVRAGKTSSRPVPTRRAPRGGGGGLNVVYGQAVGAMSGTGSHTIDNIESIMGADPRANTSDAAETLAVDNPFGYECDDDALVGAWKVKSGAWHVFDAVCPEEE